MAKDLPKPLAESKARIEVKRTKAERWFNKQSKKDKTTEAFDETLLGYVHYMFLAYAEEILSVGRKLNWPAAEVRQRIDRALQVAINEAFSSKHYHRYMPSFRAGFRRSAEDCVHASREWDGIQTQLMELAEREAAGGDHQGCLDPIREAVTSISGEQIVHGSENGVRSMVDAFILKCKEELSLNVNRKHIWRAAGHTTARQFQFWQASNPKATAQDDQNFRRILAMRPTEFEALLKKKGIV